MLKFSFTAVLFILFWFSRLFCILALGPSPPPALLTHGLDGLLGSRDSFIGLQVTGLGNGKLRFTFPARINVLLVGCRDLGSTISLDHLDRGWLATAGKGSLGSSHTWVFSDGTGSV